MLAAELGEFGRLGDVTIDIAVPSVPFDGSTCSVVERGLCADASCADSGELRSTAGTTESLPAFECREGKEFAVGVGEGATGKEPEDDFSGGFEALSPGEGNPCTTLSNNLLVRTPAD